MVIRRPLVLVPGFMASYLWRSGDGHPELLWPPVGPGRRGRLKDLLHPKKRAKGVLQEAYNQLLEFLDRLGYELGSSLWLFAYDWTQSIEKSGQEFRKFVARVLARCPGQAVVDVIGHSMGGLVVRAAYPLPAARVAYVATPHFGVPKAFFALHPGIGVNLGGFFQRLVVERVWQRIRRIDDFESLEAGLRTVTSGMPSLYELLPDDFYLAHDRAVVQVETHRFDRPGPGAPPVHQIVGRTEVFGSESTYFGPDCGLPQEMYSRIRAALATKQRLGRAVSRDGVETLVIYSKSEETVDVVTCNCTEASPWSGPTRGFGEPCDSGQGGDGTVPAFSARGGVGDARCVTGTHRDLPNLPATFDLLKELLAKPRASGSLS